MHTDVGHRCRGAKVNGRIVPLNFQPVSGDRVEILTGKAAEPRRDWLSAQHGFLTTQRARAKVRAWFKRIDHDANLAAGREILEREFTPARAAQRRPGNLAAEVPSADARRFARRACARRNHAGQVARALHEEQTPAAPAIAVPARAPKRDKDAVVIEGVGNLLTSMARCCQPLPGDAIVGYITRGKGVSIHRADCASFARLRARDPDRAIEVEWGSASGPGLRHRSGRARLRPQGLHKDVTNVIAAANITCSRSMPGWMP